MRSLLQGGQSLKSELKGNLSSGPGFSPFTQGEAEGQIIKGLSNSASPEVPALSPMDPPPTSPQTLTYLSAGCTLWWWGLMPRASWSVTVTMSTEGKHRDIGKETQCFSRPQDVAFFLLQPPSRSSLFLTERIHTYLPGKKPLSHSCSSVPLVPRVELSFHPVGLPSALGNIGFG